MRAIGTQHFQAMSLTTEEMFRTLRREKFGMIYLLSTSDLYGAVP